MFEQLLDELRDRKLGIHAIEVNISGNTVLHRCFDGDVRYPAFSVTKSVTSAAFSMLCDDGSLSCDMPLSEFLENRYKPQFRNGFEKLLFERFGWNTYSRLRRTLRTHSSTIRTFLRILSAVRVRMQQAGTL